MNIRNWAGWITNFSSLYKSSDNGITWTRCQNVKFGSTSNFGQVSYFKKDGYIYMVGTITGRDNKPHLARFQKKILKIKQNTNFGMEVDGLKEMKLQPLHYSMIYLENFPSLIIQNLKMDIALFQQYTL